MNKFLTEYFDKKGYLLFCPKSHNFGGFHESLLWALKIKKYKNYKIIINFPLISTHGHYKTFFKKNYGKKIILNYLNTLSFREIILSLMLTLLGNILILIVKLKFLFLFNLIFKKKFDKFKFPFLGFGLRQIEEFDTYSKIEINNILETNINLGSKKVIQNNTVSFCVKDNNYSLYKDISAFASADINNYKKSIIYLINNGYKISRVGENSMTSIDFKHSQFRDFSRSKKHFEYLHQEIKNSDFYFGTGASHSLIPDLYDKNKVITNNIDFIQSSVSNTYKNFGIYKKIFCLKQKKILSLEEIFFDGNLFFLKIDELVKAKKIILLDNNPEEILSVVKDFLQKKNHSHKISNLLYEFEELKRKAINYHKRKNIKSFYISMYENSKISIPDDYLNSYLYNSNQLNEISQKFKIINNL
tara:strand:- start:37161 stop:38408 length:1248 start_codon:yes stop_codon:yes gene_type:complete